ncbi:MAG TPA: ribonuclease P protein component [Alphaproteobacteria bacterium]|jgi:ribonuclease P protein component
MKATKAQIAKLAVLKDRAAFLHAQRAGKKWVSKTIVVEAVPNDLGAIRYGLTVSKKTSKSAVVRNRIRRRLRAAARDVLPAFVLPGTDVVLVGRVESATRPYAQLKEDLRWCLGKLGVAKDNLDAA